MFKKLRNKLIWINLGITTVVIVVAFAAIYISSTNSANRRPPMREDSYTIISDDFEKMINVTVERERQAAAQDLLITLIVAGIAIELIVALISYYLAEEAIKPVKEAYIAQKVFIANASHEIKTPLAAIAANLEAADIKGNHWINNVATETEKLASLNGELLELARTDLVENVETREVNLNTVIAKTLESFEPRLAKIDFKKTISLGNEKVRTNPEDLTQILRILLDNAIKYCDNKIRLKVDGNELSVSNDGAKISEKDLPHVFERFYQVDKSAEGVGLGLSIAKSLADRNNWTLSVKSGKMTEFKLHFS